MIEFEVETEIGRAPANVFRYVTDPAKLATWQTSTVSAEPEDGEPVRLGTRIREVHRRTASRRARCDWPNRWSSGCSNGSLPATATRSSACSRASRTGLERGGASAVRRSGRRADHARGRPFPGALDRRAARSSSRGLAINDASR